MIENSKISLINNLLLETIIKIPKTNPSSLKNKNLRVKVYKSKLITNKRKIGLRLLVMQTKKFRIPTKI
jgi:hypothetical protein